MKKAILTILLASSFYLSYSQKKYVKKLELAKTSFTFYEDSPFNNVFIKVGRYKKNRIYIEKNCCGTFVIIQSKRIRQLSNYNIVKQVYTDRLTSIKELNIFILKLQYENSKDKIHKVLPNL